MSSATGGIGTLALRVVQPRISGQTRVISRAFNVLPRALDSPDALCQKDAQMGRPEGLVSTGARTDRPGHPLILINQQLVSAKVGQSSTNATRCVRGQGSSATSILRRST